MKPECDDGGRWAVLTGYGDRDTHATILNDRRVNPHPSAGTPYNAITWPELVDMAMDPPQTPKAEGQWLIPSSYCGFDGREHAAQRERGQFRLLCLDIDGGSPSLDAVEAALAEVLGGPREALIYSTRSSTQANMKWRAMVPLTKPVPGHLWPHLVAAFNEGIAEVGLKPDRALERTGQVIFLPNRGAFYEAVELDGPRFDPSWMIGRAQSALREEELRRDWARQAALKRTTARGSVIAEWCLLPNRSVDTLLAKYGYDYAGNRSNDWRSPYQRSGSYATRAYDDGHWVSLSESDARMKIGRAVGGGEDNASHRHGDAFDLFVHFEHGNDFSSAMRAAAREVKAAKGAALGGRNPKLITQLQKLYGPATAPETEQAED